MIGAPNYPIYGQQMQPAYPQTYRPVYQPPQPMQPQMDAGMVNARYVTCREEAVAAQIIPDGSAYYFICDAQNRIYSKRFNPQTGAPEFREFAAVSQQNPAEQYATLEMLAQVRGEIDQIKQVLTAQPAARQRPQKEVNADA